MDRFGRAIDEEMKLNTGGIVGGLFHKGYALRRPAPVREDLDTQAIIQFEGVQKVLMWPTWKGPLAIGYKFLP